MKVVVYTDGGADPNPGYGGWAAVLRYDGHEKVLTGSAAQTTNNRMELQAAQAALAALKRGCEVTLYTDSQYVRQGITQWIAGWARGGWLRRGKPIPNRDLWESLWAETQRHTIEWQWVRGHAGDPLNERVDRLAREARLAITPRQERAVVTHRLYLRASVKGNPGPGGWGVVAETAQGTRQYSGSEPATTNNRMELLAAVEGLRETPAGAAVAVVTTSDYVFQGATRWIKGWRGRGWTKKDGKPVGHADLWRQLDALQSSRRVHWESAKGRQGDLPAGLVDAARCAAAARDLA
jgi:ribonuclease HI